MRFSLVDVRALLHRIMILAARGVSVRNSVQVTPVSHTFANLKVRPPVTACCPLPRQSRPHLRHGGICIFVRGAVVTAAAAQRDIMIGKHFKLPLAYATCTSENRRDWVVST